MKPNHILTLPREIRDKIYIYAFSSPTGYLQVSARSEELTHFALVSFKPPKNIHPGRIRLSLLQTCKQINHEATAALLFKHNTLALSIYLLPQLPKNLDVKLSHRIQHLWLGLDLTHRPGLEPTAQALEAVSRWAEAAGELQTLTLGVVGGWQEMHALMEVRILCEPDAAADGVSNPSGGEDLFGEYLALLETCRRDGRWGRVARRLELRVGRMKGFWFFEPRETVEELHEAFGGELWVDGRLCYRDGVEILQPFQPAAHGEFQVAWFREGESPILEGFAGSEWRG